MMSFCYPHGKLCVFERKKLVARLVGHCRLFSPVDFHFWTFGFLDIWISGYLDFSVSRLLGFHFFSVSISSRFPFLDIWISGSLDFWIYGCLDFSSSGFLDIWIS